MGNAFAWLAAAAAVASLAGAASAASTDGKNRKVMVQNISSQTINNLYASPTAAKTWEEDLLGARTLTAGASVEANIDNGTNECMFDLKVVMASGKTFEHRQVNVCAASKWVIGDSGESIQ
ncbi:MAG TPA: hypothetical protein VH331_05370 [Allosphingosinicella sp.]|jgi:hypothetical protein|nr:hypothetical protein [Allosphingosinicella sp.]